MVIMPREQQQHNYWMAEVDKEACSSSSICIVRANDNDKDMHLPDLVNCLGSFYGTEQQVQLGQISIKGTL